MSDQQSDREYRIVASPSLALVRGSLPRALARRQRRDLIEREGHRLALVATGDGFADDPAFHWLGDLRRGQLRIWGGLLRFIDTSVRRRVPKAVMDLLAPLIQAYIDDAYEMDQGPDGGGRRQAAA